jgi:PAS domain S-box-containing protein
MNPLPTDETGAALRAAEQALQARTRELGESLSLMRATLEATADGILVTGSDGRVLAFNERFLALWGIERQQVEGRRHGDLALLVGHRFGDAPALAARIVEIDASPASEELDTLEFDDGLVLERFSHPQVLDGRVVGRVWSYRDVTARRRAERAVRDEARLNARLYDEMRRVAADRERLVEGERAARAEIARVSRLKDEFLATLSHELRTPLTAILGWARVLLRKHDDVPLLLRALEAIERNAVAQAQIVDDLLDMSRIISGTMRLEVRPTDLAAVVDAALDSVRPSADARGVRLVRVLEAPAGAVPADPGRLQQVVWNLLTNAVKFTPRGGQVEVRLRRLDSHLELIVADSGSGIAPEFLPHVFDRFRQADSSPTRSHGGLGLGLSIVKQLVEMHGGSVQAASAGTDLGATFTVRLPLSPPGAGADPQHAVPPPPSAPPLSLAGVRVLVVDDEPDARALLAHLLGERGAQVQTAASADEALQALAQRPPDVLVSDIGMPGRDGYALMRELRALPAAAGGATPAIALTAFARSEDRTRAMLAGYQLHVAKPIEPEELVAALASLAGRVPLGTPSQARVNAPD